MAPPSSSNPLGYVIERQYKDNVIIKNKLFTERLASARNLYSKDLLAHYGCVNAIEFSAEGELLVSGGDDRRVLLWSVPETIFQTAAPIVMQTTHISNIFCVAFDSHNTRIYSGGNDDQVIIHDLNTTNFVSKLAHRKPVYGLHVSPQNDDIIATAGDDGRILLFDVRESTSTDTQCLAKQKTGFHSVMFNPSNPRFLVTSNSEEGIGLWDCRKPKEQLLHYDGQSGKISGISACFDSSGDRVLALRRRLPPVIYATQSEQPICQFYHPQYYNSCTMKTCCFAGDNDEYVLSGSDDFNLYMWRVPKLVDDEWGASHLALKGHRSIVNQVRYNKHNNLIASSGVEKMIKLWSSLSIGTWSGSLTGEHSEPLRPVYSHDDYVSLVGHSGERITHDYSEQSTGEDSKMMAFFDSLIQREIEAWNSASENNGCSNNSESESEDEEYLSRRKLAQIYTTTNGVSDVVRRNKLNRIAQLIYKKRNRLARMAHHKSNSMQLRHRNKISKRKTHGKRGRKCSEGRKTRSKNNGVAKKKMKSLARVVPDCDNMTNSNSSSMLDAPSTSTGITNSNSAIYRVIEQDSDEETTANHIQCEQQNGIRRSFDESNFVNILPTPLNGTHDLFINVLEVSATNGGNGNVVTLRNEDFSHFASTSSTTTTTPNTNGRRSSRLASTSNRAVTFSDCLSESDSADSDYVAREYRTPLSKIKKRSYSASDSGCGTGPSSSKRNARRQVCTSATSGATTSTAADLCSSDDELYDKLHSKKVNKARLDVRKKIAVDSDSN